MEPKPKKRPAQVHQNPELPRFKLEEMVNANQSINYAKVAEELGISKARVYQLYDAILVKKGLPPRR